MPPRVYANNLALSEAVPKSDRVGDESLLGKSCGKRRQQGRDLPLWGLTNPSSLLPSCRPGSDKSIVCTWDHRLGLCCALSLPSNELQDLCLRCGDKISSSEARWHPQLDCFLSAPHTGISCTGLPVSAPLWSRAFQAGCQRLFVMSSASQTKLLTSF